MKSAKPTFSWEAIGNKLGDTYMHKTALGSDQHCKENETERSGGIWRSAVLMALVKVIRRGSNLSCDLREEHCSRDGSVIVCKRLTCSEAGGHQRVGEPLRQE